MGWSKKKIDEKPTPKPEKKPAPIVEAQNSFIEKAEIDRLKKILSEKIKDPKMAKKAAMIIAEMLNKKGP